MICSPQSYPFATSFASSLNRFNEIREPVCITTPSLMIRIPEFLKIFPVVANGNILRQYSPVEGIKKLNAMGSNLPLSSAVHCFAINNQILENSEANKGYRTVIFDYLMAHDK